METEDLEGLGADLRLPEEDTGSAYEESNEEQSSSQDEEHQVPRPPRANSAPRKCRSRNRTKKPRDSSRNQDTSESDGERSRDSSTTSQREERQRAASEWAATFQEPQSPTDIRSPIRHAAGTQSKRKAPKPPSQVRAKRLKSWYNNEYRELFNVDIHDAVAGIISEDQALLEGSQIGSSIWTAKEKDLFFSALSRLGRDNVRQIASRIETKSELEVQEYIQLLHQGMIGRSNKLLGFTDLPAAIEISNECCGLLERAGDALVSRQERTEEEVEEKKWGDLWLLNSDTIKRLDRQRTDKAGGEEIEEVLPAANLFHLRNWLELSCRIFMNPDTEEDNWEMIAEPGESPAIRATAFEDFHSLAVNITKRLVSTTLFCTMSRQRAMGSKTIKHADVNQDDVEAAVKILRLKLNSRGFWIRCTRRCNLKIFDEEWNSFMSYVEVETALRETKERSRSRSVSRHECSVSCAAQYDTDPENPTDSPSYSEDYGSEEHSLLGHEADYTNSAGTSEVELTDYLIDGEPTGSKSRREHLLQNARAIKEAERAQEKYIEALDAKASRFEEQRLWTLLRQTAPFDIKPEPIILPDQPKGVFRDDMSNLANWRDRLEYRSQWETLDTPVPEEKFERNRNRMSKRAKKRLERSRAEPELDSTDDEDAASSAHSDGNGNGDGGESHDEARGNLEHSRENFENKEALEEVRIDSDNEGNETHDNFEGDFEEPNEDQEDDYHIDPGEYQRGFEHEPLAVNEGIQAQDRALVSPSPMSEDASHFPDQSENFQDSDDDVHIKGEYDSS